MHWKILPMATADPWKAYFKVVTEPKKTNHFQKIHNFSDSNSPMATLLGSWAHGDWAQKLSKNAGFSNQKLAKFHNAIKWSIFNIFWIFFDLSNTLKYKFLEFGQIIKVEPNLSIFLDVLFQPIWPYFEVKMRSDLLMQG